MTRRARAHRPLRGELPLRQFADSKRTGEFGLTLADGIANAARSRAPTYARTLPPSAPRMRTIPPSGNPSYQGSRAISAVQSYREPSSARSRSSVASRSYQSPIASSAVPRGSAARAVRSARGRSKPAVRGAERCRSMRVCAGAPAASRRRRRRECNGLLQPPHRTNSPAPRGRHRASGRRRPTAIEGDSSTIAANVSATSSSTTRVCSSPERAVAAQSIRRTSSPGTYARSSTNS